MTNQKKLASYAAITIGSVGLIASTIALTMYHSSLSPLIVGGMIGSMLPLLGCAVLGIVSLNKDFYRKNAKEQTHIELIDNSSKLAGPAIAGAVTCFGIGAGLVALGVTSPIAIGVVTLIANPFVMFLLSEIIERSSSPPTPGSSFDGVKADGADKGCNPCPTN
ncbi:MULTISPECIES: hypothetical protein [unclassified Wolbachia]|uniref:hypothetical protein n=1 Tax=unclassified Wolbachia TaxID=2640676 RepID=UPI0030CA34AB